MSALTTAISLGGGASAGREGPAIHLGATLAGLTRRFGISAEWKRILLGCGVAAAVTASFNAPIAGVLFAHEVVLAHYALRAFVPITISSVAATVITRIHLGNFPAFVMPPHALTSYLEFPAFALLGVVAASIAILFMLSTFYASRVADRIPLPVWVRPILGGLIIGAIGIVFPEALGVGYEATDNALKQSYTLPFLIVLIAAKMTATVVTLASRFGGGVFSPTLYMGAMVGGAFGIIAAAVFPDVASSQGLYAIIGMGAVASAVLGAPLSTTLIVFELTGDYQVTMALLLANAIATALTQATIGKSFFHWQLSQRDVFLDEGPHRRILMGITVRDLMTWHETPQPIPELDEEDAKPPAPLLPSDNLGKALGLMENQKRDTYQVVNPDDLTMAVGEISYIKALKAFNDSLITVSREEHH